MIAAAHLFPGLDGLTTVLEVIPSATLQRTHPLLQVSPHGRECSEGSRLESPDSRQKLTRPSPPGSPPSVSSEFITGRA